MPISSTNIGPQDVSPTRPPLRTTQTTGHHTLVTAFLNTVMQQGFCDCLFWLEKVVRARPVFFDSFRRSITTVFARCTAPPRPSHTLWPRPRLPEYHGKGSLGDSGASMRFCPANVAQRHNHPRHTTHPKLVRMPFRLPCVSSVAPIGCCRDYVYIPSVFEWGAAVSRYNSSSKRFPKCRV